MKHKKYNGVYDPRILGLYNGKFVYYDKDDGIVIESKYWKNPTDTEIKKIKEHFGNLEKKLVGE